MPDTAARAMRGVSPVLLLFAALCFLLPFVGVSCNASALQGLAGSLPSGAGNASQTTECLTAITNTDLYSYSGLNLATGSAPSSASAPPACPATTGVPSASTDPPTVGAQPLLTVVFVLIVVGVAATILPSPRRHLVAGAAALLAAILVIVNNSVVHTAVSDRITALVNKASGPGNFSLQGSGGAGTFFNIHPALGFVLILVALFAAAAANAAGFMGGSGLRLAHAPPGATPPGEPWRPSPTPGTAGAPPPAPERPPPASS